MDDKTHELLMKARDEIISLRQHNEILSAKVEMVNFFSMVLHTQAAVQQGQGHGEDIAWLLSQAIDEGNTRGL